MKKNNIFKTFILLIGLACSFSCSKESNLAQKKETSEKISRHYEINFTPAKTSGELLALRKDVKANLIRTVEEFEAIVAARNTPLARLSKEQIGSFRSSITFRKGVGVVSFNYGEIRSQLSYEEFAEVMKIFGLDIKQGYWGLSNDPTITKKMRATKLQSTVLEAGAPRDYIDYWCKYPQTCQKRKDWICMAGC